MKVGHLLAIVLLCVSFAMLLSLTPTVVCDPPMKINFTQVGVGTDFTGNVLTVDGSTNYQVATLPKVYNWQVNDTHTFSWLSPLTVSADKRYAWVSTSGLSTLQGDTITVTVDGLVLASYKTQYYVTVSATAGGSVDLSTGWYDGSGSVPVAATPDSGFLFKNWVVTGGVSVADPNGASTTMTVTGAGTLQAVFESQVTWEIFFNLAGVGSDFNGNVLTLDAVNYGRASFNFSQILAEGSAHPFSWLSPLVVFSDKQYLWASTNGLSILQSGSMTVPSGTGSLTGSYKTQYYVALSAGTGGTINASSAWHDDLSVFYAAATPGTGYSFKNWTATGGASVSDPNSPVATITVTGGGSVLANFEPLPFNVSFSQSGVGTDFSGTVVNVDAVGVLRTDLPKTYTWLYGSSHGFSWLSPLVVSADKQYVWVSTSGLSTAQGTSITITSAGSVDAVYKTQYYVTITTGAGGAVNRASGWYDASSPIAITATPNSGYGFKNWTATGGVSVADPNSPTTTMTVGGAGTLQAYFELLPVEITFARSGIGLDFSGAVVNVDGAPLMRSDLPKVYNWTVGSNHTFSWVSPLVVSGSKQYVWNSTTGLSTAQSGTITVPTLVGGVTGNYLTQYYVTITAGAGGAVNRGSGWYYSASPVSITATPNSGYSFKNWTTTGGVSVADPNNPSTTMTAASAGTLQANFELLPVGISFMQSGIGTDFSGVVLNVDGSPLVRSDLTKTYNWTIGSSHTFSWLSPLTVSSSKRYAWVSTTGLSTAQGGTIIIPNGTGYVGANYVAQYYVDVTAGAGGTVNASSGWRDTSGTMVVTATPGVGYNFKSWVVTGGVSVSDPNSPTTTLTVSGAGSVQATFEIMIFEVSFAQSGVGADFLGTVVNVDGAPVLQSELTKAYNWSYGGSHTFSWLSPLAVSGSEQYIWTSTSGLSTLQSGSILVTSAGPVTGSYEKQYYVTITAGSGGTVNASSAWHDASSVVYVTASPGLTYGFKSWVVTGNVSVSDPNNPSTAVTVDGAGTLQATFDVLPVGVSFFQYGIGTDFSGAVVDVDGAALLRSDLIKTYSWSIGSTHTFSWLSPLVVSPEKRYVWASTSGISTLQDGSITTPSGSGAVMGSYYVEYFVTVEGSEGGTTDLGPGDWYRADQAVSVSATPSEGYRFSGWTATGGVAVADSAWSSTTFTASGPGGIRANFEYAPPGITVTFQSSVGGSTSPSGSGSYQPGESVEISAVPENGYRFSAWEVAGDATVLSPASQSTTLTVNGPATVTANFIAVFNVTFQASAGGSTTPSGYGSYLQGTSVTIVAVPAEGWRFLGWNVTGDATAEDPASPITTLTINGHAVVIARFRQGDSSPPVVSDIYPADGTVISNGSFTISASFSDDTAIDPSSVVLKVDGSEVSGAQVSESGVSYVASLGAGTHRVELTVKDTEGNPRTVTWSVVAVEGPQPVPWELWAVIGVEVVTAGLIGYYWWTRKKPAALPKVEKKPVTH